MKSVDARSDCDNCGSDLGMSRLLVLAHLCRFQLKSFWTQNLYFIAVDTVILVGRISTDLTCWWFWVPDPQNRCFLYKKMLVSEMPPSSWSLAESLNSEETTGCPPETAAGQGWAAVVGGKDPEQTSAFAERLVQGMGMEARGRPWSKRWTEVGWCW